MDGLLAWVDRPFLTAIGGPAPASKKARQTANISAMIAVLPPMLARFQINTPLRLAHFFSQTGHESDGFCTMREYADGSAYEGRKDLGNTVQGDGRRYPGRGLIELTGRGNARLFTLWMRKIDASCPDFEASPELLETFPWAAWCAVYFWEVNNLNALADRDDLITITKRINGGKNGLDDRGRRLAIGVRLVAMKAEITPIAADLLATEQRFPVLYRGVRNRREQVETLQRLLAQANYYHLTTDGDFGPGTEGAVRALQSRLKLQVDGLAGLKTFQSLLTLLHLRAGPHPWTIATT